MLRFCRPFLIAAMVAPAILASAARAQTTPWDGRWAGEWNAVDASSFTVAEGQVETFVYKGKPEKFDHATIEGDRLTLKNDDVTISLTLQNAMHASGQYYGPLGAAYGTFTKQ